MSKEPIYPHVPKRRVQNWQTAIARTLPPAPLRWLYDNGLLKGRCLDFGSGRNCWYSMDCYDPYWQPKMPTGLFDTITCIYVLNVVSKQEEDAIIHEIKSKLKLNGIAYFSVRRDIPVSGTPTQRWSTPDLEEIAGNHAFAIYFYKQEKN